MSIFDKVQAEIKKQEDAGHAERNRLNAISMKQAKERLLYELSAQQAVSFVFNEFPAAGVKQALALELLSAETMEELRDAPKNAELFKNVKACNTMGSHDRITSSMHQLVDSIKGYLYLATHEDSDGGVHISKAERAKINKFMENLEALLKDLHLYMDSKAEVIE